MVKNATDLDNLADVIQGEDNGNLMVDGTIIASGEIRAGDVSASKFYLGTEEMPLVKANPAGEATETLEKVKIGNVAYNVGSGGSSDRLLNLTVPYPKGDTTDYKKTYVDNEIYNKITGLYYETIKVFYNDGNPLGVFNLLNLDDHQNNINSSRYACVSYYDGSITYDEWYGKNENKYYFAVLHCLSDDNGKFVRIYGSPLGFPVLTKSKFDALYKLADKPTQDGTYVLKATVSGGAVTYTWVAQ